MSGAVDAVVAAGGRLGPDDSTRFGTDVKALARIGEHTLIACLVAALRSAPEIADIAVVGPEAVRRAAPDVDRWADEGSSGEENVLLALRAGRTARVLFCAADLPFIRSEAVSGFLSRVPGDAVAAYPAFLRNDFLAAFPGGRSHFFRLADGEWTGGSVVLLEPTGLLRREALIRSAFSARKNPASLARIFGPSLAAGFALGRVGVKNIEARASALLGGRVCVILGADPCLAMDCDESADFDYALAHANDPRSRS